MGQSSSSNKPTTAAQAIQVLAETLVPKPAAPKVVATPSVRRRTFDHTVEVGAHLLVEKKPNSESPVVVLKTCGNSVFVDSVPKDTGGIKFSQVFHVDQKVVRVDNKRVYSSSQVQSICEAKMQRRVAKMANAKDPKKSKYSQPTTVKVVLRTFLDDRVVAAPACCGCSSSPPPYQKEAFDALISLSKSLGVAGAGVGAGAATDTTKVKAEGIYPSVAHLAS